jgi:hypothetical protein
MKCLTDAIAARLSAARRVCFDSARSFAKQFDVPESTYSQHETGKRALSVNALLEYSDWLSIDPGWMLTGKGLPYPGAKGGADRQSALYQHLNKIDKEQLFAFEQRYLIQHDFAIVDVALFREVLQKMMTAAKDIESLNNESLLEFAFDAYNSVVQTSADHAHKVQMIELSIASLVRGLSHQKSDQSRATLRGSA